MSECSIAELGDFIITTFSILGCCLTLPSMIKNNKVPTTAQGLNCTKLHRDYPTIWRFGMILQFPHGDMTVSVNKVKQATKFNCVNITGCNNPSIMKSALDIQHIFKNCSTICFMWIMFMCVYRQHRHVWVSEHGHTLTYLEGQLTWCSFCGYWSPEEDPAPNWWPGHRSHTAPSHSF